MAESKRSPLVIVGIDSGDPRFLRRWAEEGYLPTLASLMARGCWADTSSPELMLEHGAWVSIFSGVSRAEHGFYYFRQLQPRSYDLSLVYGAELKAPPFWASWPEVNGRVVVADVPEVALCPGVAGEQVANWAVHRGYVSRAPVHQPGSEPPDVLAQLTGEFGPPMQIVENPDADSSQNTVLYQELMSRVARKGAVCRYLVDRNQPGLAVICFGESHTAGHQFWKANKNSDESPGTNDREFRNAIRDVYQAVDREIGLLLSRMPASANVFVLSTIGLTDHLPTGELMEQFCRKLGYQAAPEKKTDRLGPMALARRFVPQKWRLALSRHLTREARERLFSQQFLGSTNWSKTMAFSIPSIYTGFIRVNLRGREPQGIVEPAQYGDVLDRIEKDLFQLIDPQTGERAIEKVVRTTELYGGGPPETLPDLVIQWKSCDHFVDRVVHPRAELVQGKPEFFRDSEHTDRGFFAAAGPAISARGELDDIEVLDLAPTFLDLLEQPKPTRMTGNVIGELFQTEVRSYGS